MVGGTRRLHLGRDLNTLIGVGTAICGASAIAATDAVIGADEADVSYAIATIFTFNVVAVLSFPSLGHLIGLSQHAFGLWAGTAINDTSSVVAASTIYGHAAVSYAVVVKLTRTLAIVPISLGLAAWRNRSARQANANPGGTDEDAGLRLSGPRTSAPRPCPTCAEWCRFSSLRSSAPWRATLSAWCPPVGTTACRTWPPG